MNQEDVQQCIAAGLKIVEEEAERKRLVLARAHGREENGAAERAREIMARIPELIRSKTVWRHKHGGRSGDFDCSASVMSLDRLELKASAELCSQGLRSIPGPDALQYAARTVYFACQEAGLSPKIVQGTSESRRAVFKIVVQWNLPQSIPATESVSDDESVRLRELVNKAIESGFKRYSRRRARELARAARKRAREAVEQERAWEVRSLDAKVRAGAVIAQIPKLVAKITSDAIGKAKKDDQFFDCAASVMELTASESEQTVALLSFYDGYPYARAPVYGTARYRDGDPYKLCGAARMVYDHCKGAGLNPLIKVINNKLQIVLQWNLPGYFTPGA